MGQEVLDKQNQHPFLDSSKVKKKPQSPQGQSPEESDLHLCTREEWRGRDTDPGNFGNEWTL